MQRRDVAVATAVALAVATWALALLLAWGEATVGVSGLEQAQRASTRSEPAAVLAEQLAGRTAPVVVRLVEDEASSR
ncbi:MAG: hypothetical protein KatS3mg102_2736 [Planctomycetota bacterium]|nr:MAG: hypothetical protein KatS3mg102_2736 [Planctomycetota bacterium]